MPTPTNSVFEIHPGLVLKGQMSMAKDIILTGKFEGDLKTLGCLTVAEGGVVTGSIEAGALVLQPGHEVEAKIKVGPQPRGRVLEDAPKSAGNKWPGRLRKLKELALGRR
jgi:hypothetical protein